MLAKVRSTTAVGSPNLDTRSATMVGLTRVVATRVPAVVGITAADIGGVVDIVVVEDAAAVVVETSA